MHAFASDSGEIKRHLCFRDYLIAHPDEAKKYAQLKLKLAKKYSDNRRAYVEGKQDFVLEIEKKALVWCSTKKA